MFASAGRNTAIRHATKDVVVIVDGHCHVPDREYLTKLSEAFAASKADCLGRPQPLDVPNPTAFQRAVSAARSSRLGHNPDSDIYSNEAKFVPPQSTAVAYARSVFASVGLFDQEFDACEDVEFNERVHAAGLTCYFTPAVKIVYEPRGSVRALFYQLGRYGSGRAKLACKHPKSLSLPALVPPLWAVWVLGRRAAERGRAVPRLAVAGERDAVRGRAARRGRGARPRATAGGGGAHPRRVRGDPLRVRVGLLEGSGKAGAAAGTIAGAPGSHPATREFAMNLVVALAIASFVAAPIPKASPEKEALAAFQGEWKMVEFVKGGEAETKEELEGSKVVAAGDKLTITAGKRKSEELTFTLDPKSEPAVIDLKPLKASKEVIVKGIYKLEKDKLTICFGLNASERPKEFKSDQDSKTGMFVLERVKK